jgi:hypothetical protein
MTQGKLFGGDPPDPPDWRRARDRGMARAEAGAAEVWEGKAWAELLHFIRTRPTFAAWEITLVLRREGITTRTERAIGPLIVKAAKLGLIVNSGQTVKNPIAHGCLVPVWRSLKYEAAT